MNLKEIFSSADLLKKTNGPQYWHDLKSGVERQLLATDPFFICQRAGNELDIAGIYRGTTNEF